MRARSAAWLIVLGLASAACSRACDGAAEPTPPADASLGPSAPLPVLEKDPLDASSEGGDKASSAFDDTLKSLSLRRGIRRDCVELRPARPGDDPKDPKFRVPSQMSESVGVVSLTLFHPAFAKAHPGFDLTVPRLLSPKELEALAHELTEMAMSLLSATDLAVAKTRWGKHSAFVRELESDGDWAKARPILAETARALGAKAKAHADAKEGLWVLAF